MAKNKMFNILFREKPAGMLIELTKRDNIYASLLAKHVDCTYSHVVKILQEMEHNKLIGFSKHGRLKNLNLTEKGTKVAMRIAEIKNILEQEE